MTLTIRPYQPQDRSECLRVFDSNIPQFFRDHERTDFEAFIDSFQCPYFVLQRDEELVGCGGYGIRPGSEVADLCWGMVAAGDHGKRLGEFLLLGRLHEIIRRENVRGVRLGTSQLTEGFFQRYGFTLVTRRQDGIAVGLDDVEMQLELTKETKQQIADQYSAS